VVVNSIASLGWKSIEMPEKYRITSCNSRNWWFDWLSMIAVAASFRQDFGLQKWVFVRQEQKNDFQKFLTPQ